MSWFSIYLMKRSDTWTTEVTALRRWLLTRARITILCVYAALTFSLSLPKAHVSHIVRIVSVRMSELKILRKDWRTSNCLSFLLFHTSRHLLRLEDTYIYIYIYKHFSKLCSKLCIKSFSFFCSRLIRVLTNDRHH